MTTPPAIPRIAGGGWLALVGGGEFSFGETAEADAAWLEVTPPGPIGFVPAASGSVDYGRHLAAYLGEEFDRQVEVIPIYRDRDARRVKNADRLAAAAAVYLGGGVADHLLDSFGGGLGAEGTPAREALAARLTAPGGVVVAIAAAAQAAGVWVRSVAPGEFLAGFGWLPGGVVEPNFDPDHDRRLRQLLARPGVEWGLALAAGSVVLLGPGEAVVVVGDAWTVRTPAAADEPLELVPLGETGEEGELGDGEIEGFEALAEGDLDRNGGSPEDEPSAGGGPVPGDEPEEPRGDG